MKQLRWQILAFFKCHKVNVLHRLWCGWQENGDDVPLLLNQNASLCRAHDLSVVYILAGTAHSMVVRSVFPMRLHHQEHEGGWNRSQDWRGKVSQGQLHPGPMGCLGEETCSKASLLRTRCMGKEATLDSQNQRRKGQIQTGFENHILTIH